MGLPRRRVREGLSGVEVEKELREELAVKHGLPKGKEGAGGRNGQEGGWRLLLGDVVMGSAILRHLSTKLGIFD